MLQDMGAQRISNIMLSSAKLGFNPDDSVPGMVHTLADTFLQLMHAAYMKQHPNAQNAANCVCVLAFTFEFAVCPCFYFACNAALFLMNVGELQGFLLVRQRIDEMGVGRHLLWSGAARRTKRA